MPLEKFKRGIDGVCGHCKEPLHLFEPVTLTDANFADQVESSTLPVLIDLWAPWCGPCRMIAPIIEQLAREWASRIRVGKLPTSTTIPPLKRASTCAAFPRCSF